MKKMERIRDEKQDRLHDINKPRQQQQHTEWLLTTLTLQYFNNFFNKLE